jgi:transposase
MSAADQLPNDIEEMKRLFLSQAANLEKLTTDLAAASVELAAARAGLMSYAIEIEKLKFQLARLRRQKYGSSSERIEREIAQLELRLEELEATKAEAEAKGEAAAPATPTTTDTAPAKTKKPRRKFPEKLPRTTVVHEPKACPTPGCDGALRKVSEDVTEVLKYIPGRFEVERHVRPAMSCRKCETMVQAPMPALPIPRGEADASVLAHVATAKYCDHIPLYRQSEIYARDGVDLGRSLLADWNGKSAWLLDPLAQKIGEHVMAGRVIHADDTPVNVLAPGHGKTKTGRFWAYLRDERATSGRRRRRWSTTTRPTARASIAGRIWLRSVATFMPMGTQDLVSCTIGKRTPNLVQSPRSLVGATRDGSSSMCTSRTARRLPKRRSSGSACCSTSSARSQASRRTCGNRYVHSWPNPGLMSWPFGSISSCNAFPDAASWPRRSAMHALAGSR